jgi:predicted nucleic acid-binding protein
MTRFVLDASVAIAWYLPESFTESAHTWLSRLYEGHASFFVPRLHYWEFANVLQKHVRRNFLGPQLANEIWDTHLDTQLKVADPPTGDVLPTALAYGATAYDAVYIALALTLDIPLVTAERSTTAWVKKLGSQAISIATLPS